MNELELIINLFENTQRQGPGSDAETIKALSFIDIANRRNLKVADIGCGTGSQTITLATHLHGKIIAVDLFPQFLKKLRTQAIAMGMEDKIEPMAESMEALPFEDEEFGIIWSEGAIYNIGFEKGISEWRKYLKKGGYLAVSEITWLTNSRPKEIETYWQREYPEIDTASNKMRVLERNGYTPVGYFILSPQSWTDNFFMPIEKQFNAFLEKHIHSKLAHEVVNQQKKEIQLFHRYKEYFNYGFYIAKKI